MLHVKDLSFNYLREKTIDKISFRVKEGEFACLLGPNGSGKTTTLKCINGILSPQKGDILIDGQNLRKMNRREIARHISMVPQEHTVVFAYKVIEVVAMGVTPYLFLGSMPGEEVYHKAEDILEELNISHLATRNYNEISAGERQLVLIARALMQNSKLLILDEPTAHLDFKNTYHLLRIIKQLTEKDKTVITALHDPNLALKFADRVIMLKNGRILTEGRPEATMTAENLRKIYDINVISRNISGGVKLVIPELD